MFLCEIIMFVIYLVVTMQRIGGKGRWIWLLQRWMMVVVWGGAEIENTFYLSYSLMTARA